MVNRNKIAIPYYDKKRQMANIGPYLTCHNQQRSGLMKGIGILLGTLGVSAFTLSMAFANPGLLPAHPGYPAAGKSPVTGQPTANDPGQANAVGGTTLQAAQQFGADSVKNKVTDPNRARIKQSAGAGRLPEIEGPLNKITPNPAGASSTVIK